MTIKIFDKEYFITETETKWLIKNVESKLSITFEAPKAHFPTLNALQDFIKENLYDQD